VEHRQFEFVHFAQQASDPLMTVLQYIAHTYMIDNVILIMTGALHGRSFEELAEKCHPLGLFDSIENLMIANDIRDIHRIVLVDTPVSTYFTECLGYGSLDEANLEMVRSCAYKAYLQQFVECCNRIQSEKLEDLYELLSLLHFEADKWVINIVISTMHTDISASDKRKLFPSCGQFYPNVQTELANCTDFDELRQTLDKYRSTSKVASRLASSSPEIYDKVLREEECYICERIFAQRTPYAIFVAYFKLCEFEVRNIMWIAECIVQQQRSRIEEGVVYYKT